MVFSAILISVGITVYGSYFAYLILKNEERIKKLEEQNNQPQPTEAC